MANYIKKKRIWSGFPDLNFGGSFTTVSVTNGVSDIMHTDRNDAGVTWVFPIGEFEGGELSTPNYQIKIPVPQGDAIAFQSNFLGHMSAPLKNGIRLALTCFTDKNIMVDSQKYWKKKNEKVA